MLNLPSQLEKRLSREGEKVRCEVQYKLSKLISLSTSFFVFSSNPTQDHDDATVPSTLPAHDSELSL